jgi:outer membrane protein TolC
MEYLTKNKIVFLLSVLCLSANPLFAQTTKTLTLQEAIQLGVDNSKMLKVSSAKVDQATASLESTKMNQYPDLKISGSYLRFNSPNVDIKTGGSGSDSSSTSIPKVNSVMYGMATASVPLFAGLKIRNSIESAKYLKKATELDAQQDKDEVTQNIIAAYYNLYKAQSALKIVNEQLKQERQRVTDFTNLESNGIIARNDLLQAKLAESNVELDLVDAENEASISNYNMDLMLGLDENTELTLNVNELGKDYKIQTLEFWETSALSNRSDLLAVQQRQSAAASNVKATKGDYYPTVALSGGYVAANIPNLFSVYNAVDAGVGVSYNLANLYKNGSRVKEAKAQQNQLYWSSLELNDNVKMQIHKAYQDYLQSLKKIEVYKVAVDQANENYRITKDKYDNSLSTTTDLLDADVAQLRSTINYEFAKADAEVAYNKLYQTSGLINGANKTTATPETK